MGVHSIGEAPSSKKNHEAQDMARKIKRNSFSNCSFGLAQYILRRNFEAEFVSEISIVH
jgi:hypothetical protein